MSYRYNDDVKINITSKVKSREIETCKIKYGDYFFNDYKKDYYGNIQHKRTIISNDIDIDRIDIFDIREKMKNIRKLTDIIIFTNGFSYSATSHFIKSTQLLDGAIIVGYEGNPQIESFDSSQSPSAVSSTDNMNDDLSKEHRLTNQFFKKSKIYNKKSFNSYNSKEFLLENINNEINSLYSLYRKNKYKKILPFTM